MGAKAKGGRRGGEGGGCQRGREGGAGEGKRRVTGNKFVRLRRKCVCFYVCLDENGIGAKEEEGGVDERRQACFGS